MDACDAERQKCEKAMKKLEGERDLLDSKKAEVREMDIREQVSCAKQVSYKSKISDNWPILQRN